MTQHNPASLTEMFVQMQKTILQLTARVEALERAEPAPDDGRVVVPVGPELRAKLAMALLCEKVAKRHGVSIADMKARRGQSPLVEARRVFCRLARAEGFSLPQIGRFLGGRDHTTILQLSKPDVPRDVAGAA